MAKNPSVDDCQRWGGNGQVEVEVEKVACHFDRSVPACRNAQWRNPCFFIASK